MTFWVETIKHGYKYCICEHKWKNIKVVNYKIFHDFLEIYLTPERGERVVLYKIRNGESFLLNNMTIGPFDWQHIKIEVYGGDISICGVVRSSNPKKIPNHFATNCPFADPDDDWEMVEKNIKDVLYDENGKNIIQRSYKSSLDDRSSITHNTNINDKRSLLRERFESAITFLTSIENFYNGARNQRGYLIKNLRTQLELIEKENLNYIEFDSNGAERDHYMGTLLFIYKLVEKIKLVHQRELYQRERDRYIKEIEERS